MPMFWMFRGAALLSLLILSSGTIAVAQGPENGAVPQNAQPIFIDLRAPAAARSAPTDALLRKAARRGQVRVIVGLATSERDDETLSELEAAAQRLRLRVAQERVAARAGVPSDDVVRFDTIPFVSMWVTAAQLRRLLADPGIVNIQEDVPGTAGVTKSVPYIKAPKLWSQGFTGGGWTIAVLDTGVQKSHPMFSGKVVSEACYSTKNAGQNLTPLCPNGQTQQIGPGAGVNCNPNLGQCFHGTHVAGIAAGADGNRRGVARAAKIIAIQVFTKQGNQTITFDTDWVRGLERVYALRGQFEIAAVNMSLGFGEFSGPCDTQVPAATSIIKKLRKAGIATIVASMNDFFNNKMRSPACIGAAIAVGATGRTSDAIAGFSNHAPQVRHMAPGVGILSAIPVNKYKQENGTSMAAPHVAGAYALLRDVRGNSTVDDIAAALECTGKPTSRAGITENRIDLAKAKAYLLNPPKQKKDFTFASAEQGWVAHAGGWEFVPGFLHINEGSAGFKVASVGHCNEGADITAWLTRQGPGTQNLIGIFFKTQFTGPGARVMSGYLAAYNRNGNVVLRRFDNVDLATGSGGVASLCNGNANVQPNDFNKIKVVTRGGLHKLQINNTQVCSAIDFTYGTGRTGPFTFLQFSSGQNGFAVDRFIIDPVEKVPAKLVQDGGKLLTEFSADGAALREMRQSAAAAAR